MDNKLIIGSHVNMNENEFLLGSVKSALMYKANAFMFYTGAPQNTLRRPVKDLMVKEALEEMRKNNLDINNVVVHAPYLINLASLDNEKYHFGVQMLLNECQRVEEMGFKYLVLHPGAHLKNGFEEVFNNVIKGLNYVISKTSSVIILLETMSGKGSEVGRTFKEISTLLKGVENQDRIGVCLDTCHIFDGGYDIVNDLDSVLEEFNDLIGFDKLYVIHINDSKNPCGSSKDRHENIGFGCIGFDSLLKIIYHPLLMDKIKILETPWVGLNPPYKEEIEMIRNKEFDPLLKEKLLSK